MNVLPPGNFIYFTTDINGISYKHQHANLSQESGSKERLRPAIKIMCNGK